MRKRLEMTQAELARALGMQRNSITLMEAGEDAWSRQAGLPSDSSCQNKVKEEITMASTKP